MEHRFYIFILLLGGCFLTASLSAQQLKLGNTPTSIHPSAVLQLDSKNQGLLLPRVLDTTLIKYPNDGMLIFLAKPPNEGTYVYEDGGWRTPGYVFTTTKESHTIEFMQEHDTINFNLPNASGNTGAVSNGAQYQTFYGQKGITDSLVSKGGFNSRENATIEKGFILRYLPRSKPGYLLTTDGDGNVKLGTDPDAWIAGGNEVPDLSVLGTTSANDLSIITNNQEQMHITRDGNVCIGTSSSTDALDINGSFKFGKDGSSFEQVGEATATISSYLNQINLANILILGDKSGSFIFTLNIPSIKKGARVIVNPKNDWNNLEMRLKASLLFLIDLNLDLGDAKVQLSWARAPQDREIEICLIFDFNGIANLNAVQELLHTLLDNLNNPLLTLNYSAVPIELNVLYFNTYN